MSLPHARRVLRALALMTIVTSSLVAQDAVGATTELVAIPRPPGQLVGTLLVPHGGAAVPVVLLIAGSGPTDRDGNAPGFTSAHLRQLAESLAAHQIATLRFDKRGIGGSASAAIPEVELTFDLLTDDVAAWIRFLSTDRRFSRIIVAGHSEGALLGLRAMRQAPAAAYVSLEGPARSADAILHEQMGKQMPAPLLARADTILARLRRGVRVDSTPPELASLFRPSVQPYLMSWFRYAAQSEIASVTVPCLVVQGTHDLQVATTEADLLLQANPRCEVARIPGMNHVLKLAPADPVGQLASYRAPDAPLAPGLVGAIVSFVSANRRAGEP